MFKLESSDKKGDRERESTDDYQVLGIKLGKQKLEKIIKELPGHVGQCRSETLPRIQTLKHFFFFFSSHSESSQVPGSVRLRLQEVLMNPSSSPDRLQWDLQHSGPRGRETSCKMEGRTAVRLVGSHVRFILHITSVHGCTVLSTRGQCLIHSCI